MLEKLRQKPLLTALLVAACVLVLAGIGTGSCALWYYNLYPQKTYTAADFDIATIQSTVDFDSDGIDDYTDILQGARQEAERRPTYNGQYFQEGYPPEDIGVCTDTIWRAFRNAGYSLRAMVERDIAENTAEYPIDEPDTGIDFCRVRNLRVFFDKYAVSLTTDIDDLAQW